LLPAFIESMAGADAVCCANRPKGLLGKLIKAGCNGCIGMGQALATGRISLRTVPRNFLGRSGTKDDQVYLCSPETPAASALAGVITDPRTLPMEYPTIKEPDRLSTRLWSRRLPTMLAPNAKLRPEIGALKARLD